MRLSAAERARLIERLIASLDTDPVVEEAWAAEVERRSAEIESGAVSPVPGPEVLASLRAEFR
jgi:putative addiction module component (TIGR02574 family)